MRVCVCVCVCARANVCVYACVCVCVCVNLYVGLGGWVFVRVNQMMISIDRETVRWSETLQHACTYIHTHI